MTITAPPRAPLGGYAKPKWELYDLEDNPEHQLARSAIQEFTDIVGIKVMYYRRDPNTNYDQLYGEFQGQGFLTPIETKVLYDVGEEPNLWNVWGMVGGDIITAHMPRGTWYRDISTTEEPTIGDVIFLPWMNRVFEIAHVDDDDKIFQLKKLIWVLILRPFRYSDQSTSATSASVDIHDMATPQLTAFGDNEYIEQQSNSIEPYTDIDTKIYGY